MLVPSLRGLTKTAGFAQLPLHQQQALIGGLGGGALGAGAGYLLSDEDKKKRGMLAGGLVGAGIGGVGGYARGGFGEQNYLRDVQDFGIINEIRKHIPGFLQAPAAQGPNS